MAEHPIEMNWTLDDWGVPLFQEISLNLHMNLPTFIAYKSPSLVGKYSSTMEQHRDIRNEDLQWVV